MAIRQVTSRSIADGTIATVDIADSSITGDKDHRSVLVVLVFSRRKWFNKR